MRRARTTLAIVVTGLVAIGCTTSSPNPSPSSGSPAPEPSAAPSESTAATSGDTALIPQPDPPEGLDVAPAEDRVDLAVPTFSNPTDITNPLFPVSSQHSVLLTGTVEDQAFRTEVTLLPYTRILQWEGQQVELLVSQYVAFLDGRIEEVAHDLYAQADDGSVWYFGEDVFNFANGSIADTHGTWIAGIDGPAAMIMPADPQVGDVYRPENIPGLVFEEVTVVSTEETLDGPFGPIEGGLLVHELHMDGETEDKQFAPGYGEFYTAAGGEVEALTLAVPADAADGAEPEQLAALIDEARSLIAALDEGDADAADQALDAITAAYESYPADGVPALLRPLLDEAVERLSTAVADGDDAAASQAAIDIGRLGLDLALRYREPAGVEIGRFDVWLAQVQLDAAAEDAALLNGDYFALDYVRERFVSDIGAEQSAALNLGMEELIGAIAEEDFKGVAEISADLRATLEEITPTG